GPGGGVGQHVEIVGQPRERSHQRRIVVGAVSVVPGVTPQGRPLGRAVADLSEQEACSHRRRHGEPGMLPELVAHGHRAFGARRELLDAVAERFTRLLDLVTEHISLLLHVCSLRFREERHTMRPINPPSAMAPPTARRPPQIGHSSAYATANDSPSATRPPPSATIAPTTRSWTTDDT